MFTRYTLKKTSAISRGRNGPPPPFSFLFHSLCRCQEGIALSSSSNKGTIILTTTAEEAHLISKEESSSFGYEFRSNMPASPSSSSNNSEQKEIETREIPVPWWAVAIGVTLLIGTLTIVYRADHFGPDNYQFRGRFCVFYTTLYLATVCCCCGDAGPEKKRKIKTVEGSRPRRSVWM